MKRKHALAGTQERAGSLRQEELAIGASLAVAAAAGCGNVLLTNPIWCACKYISGSFESESAINKYELPIGSGRRRRLRQGAAHQSQLGQLTAILQATFSKQETKCCQRLLCCRRLRQCTAHQPYLVSPECDCNALTPRSTAGSTR